MLQKYEKTKKNWGKKPNPKGGVRFPPSNVKSSSQCAQKWYDKKYEKREG